jgi:hypothetical protein
MLPDRQLTSAKVGFTVNQTALDGSPREMEAFEATVR